MIFSHVISHLVKFHLATQAQTFRTLGRVVQTLSVEISDLQESIIFSTKTKAAIHRPHRAMYIDIRATGQRAVYDHGQ